MTKSDFRFTFNVVLYVLVFPACLLQKQSVDYARVREYSLRVLTWRPDDVKALYRAGVAILEMGDAQTAKHYLTKACNEQPHGMTIFCSFSTDIFCLHVSELFIILIRNKKSL